MSRSNWKSPFVHYTVIEELIKNERNVNRPIKTYSRSTKVLKSFVGLTFNIHNGKNFVSVHITDSMVGHKLGEFSFTRKMGKIHKKRKK